MQKKIFLICLSLLIFSSCSFFQKDQTDELANSQIIGETLLPQDIMLLFKFSPENKAEYANFLELKNLFSTEKNRSAFEETLNAQFNQYNLNYAQDLKPIIGTGSETILAIQSTNNQDLPNFFIIQKIAKIEGYEILTKKLLQQKHIIALKDGYELKNETNPNLFFGQKNNFIILTNSKENLNLSVNLTPQQSLVYSERYSKTRENLPTNSLGLFYMNTKLFFEDLAQATAQSQSGANLMFTENSLGNMFLSNGTTLHAEKDGIKITGFIEGDQKLIDPLFKFNHIPNEKTYLDQKLPGLKTYLYFEKFNLKGVYEQFMHNIEKSSPDLYAEYLQAQESFEKNSGIKFDQDLLSWMDKGFAFSIKDSGYAVPAFTLAIDASNNTDGATKILNTLDSFISIGTFTLQEYATALQRSEIEVNQGKLKNIKLNISDLPLEVQEQGSIITGLLDGIELSYGLTGDKIFLISTDPKLSQSYQKETLMQDNVYKALKKNTPTKTQGITYFNLSNTLENLDRLSEVLPFQTSNDENLAEIKKYISIFKGAIFSSNATEYSYTYQGKINLQQ